LNQKLDGYLGRVTSPGPKRLLALDGGGIRGALTLEILAGLEDLIRLEIGAGDGFVLADWFDYVAGTSTGAIIAAGLAQGMPVSRLRALYQDHGKEMFDRAFILNRFSYKYDSTRLQALLQGTLGRDTRLGDPGLRTLLMMVLRNASTDSPWPLSNAPGAKYNDRNRPDCNLKLPLWQLVRASTAAPTYFPAEVIDVGEQQFVFVDGGMTTYNDPALQLFLMATLPEYGLGWKAGEDEVLLVSVGTGTAPKSDDRLRSDDMNLLYNASSVPAALMVAALHQQDMLCRVLGRCRFGPPLDREVGDLLGAEGIFPSRRMTYVRYCPELTWAGLGELGLSGIDPGRVQRLDSVDHVAELQRIGAAYAQAHLDRSHLRGFLTR
jgi:hypothetical protein